MCFFVGGCSAPHDNLGITAPVMAAPTVVMNVRRVCGMITAISSGDSVGLPALCLRECSVATGRGEFTAMLPDNRMSS